MKRGDPWLIDVVVGGVLLLAGVVTWQKWEVSNRWVWNREARQAQTGEGVVFAYTRIENCPRGPGRAEKKLRRSLATPGPKESTFTLHEWPSARTGPRARRPYVYSIFFPSSYGDATRDRERDPIPAETKTLSLPLGSFFTVRRTREGELTHNSVEGSHTHRTVTYEWFSPRAPAAILSYTRDLGTTGLDNPPTRPEDLPNDFYFQWERLDSISRPEASDAALPMEENREP